MPVWAPSCTGAIASTTSRAQAARARRRADGLVVERLAAAGEHSDDPPVGEITTDTGSFAALIWHGGSLEHALSSGKLRLSADRSAWCNS